MDSTTSLSPSSGSGTTPRVDLFRRKPKVRQVQESDFRWFWAAYNQGMWRELLPEGMGTLTFKQAMTDILGAAQYDWMILAPGIKGHQPVGLVLANPIAAGRGVEAHVDWFPWATTRNRMEGIAIYLREISKQFKIFIFSEEKDEKFYLRFARYRMLRRGCRVLDYFSRGEHAMLFFTVGP